MFTPEKMEKKGNKNLPICDFNITKNSSVPIVSKEIVATQMLVTSKSRADPVAKDSPGQTPELTCKQDPHLKRLQCDLNSPSASLRMRAVHALRSPTKANYINFDVPHDEVSIITEEERNPPPPPSVNEILKDVVVYVEVRTGNDNRSEGVKSIIARLGAQVNDRLLRNTTHVVFKEGLLSTYKRAQSWNIPIVSILWIEACKVQRRLCDPQQFPISNIHMYEFPELYGKMSRVRCIQPDSELNRRPRKRPETPTGAKDKELTPKPAVRAATATKMQTTPTTTKTPQSQITRFFNPVSQTKKFSEDECLESPATVLLNKINSGCFTLVHVKSQSEINGPTEKGDKVNSNAIAGAATEQDTNKSMNQRYHLRKTRSVSFTVEATQEITPLRRSRRHSVNIGTATSQPAVENVSQMPRHRLLNFSKEANTDNSKSVASPPPLVARMTRRRSLMQNSELVAESPTQLTSQAILTCRLSNTATSEVGTPKISKKPTFQAILEEPLSHPVESMDISTPMAEKKNKSICNKTNYVYHTMELSENRANIIGRAMERRTICGTMQMELTKQNNENKDPHLVTSMETFAPKVTTQTSLDSFNEQTLTPVFSSTRLPGSANTTNRRRTLFSVDLEHIHERINAINTSAQRRSLALANEAELGESRAVAPPQAVPLQNSTPNELKSDKPKRRRLFTPNEEVVLTPSNFIQKSRPSFCSNKSKLVPTKRQSVSAIPKPLAAVHPTVQDEVDQAIRTQDASDKEFVTPYDSAASRSSSDSSGGVIRPAAKRRAIYTLAHTNMHKEQVQVIHKAIRKLGGMRLDLTVTKRTTHLVSLEPRRTLNLLRGLMRGVWIVDYKWVLESLRSGKWLNEEKYELTSFSRAVEICRTERQAFGMSYRCELFRFMETFYVSSLCRPVTFNNIKQLLLLGGAKLTDNRYKAKFIVGDKRRADDDRIYLSPLWVLDSITAMQVQKFGKYLMKSAIVTPYGIRYEDPCRDDEEHQRSRRLARVCYKDPTLVINK